MAKNIKNYFKLYLINKSLKSFNIVSKNISRYFMAQKFKKYIIKIKIIMKNYNNSHWLINYVNQIGNKDI